MLLKLFAMFTLTTALVGPVSAASVEVRPFGEQDGQDSLRSRTCW